MYPDGRTNPTPAHFAQNTPVEFHPPVSLRLLQQRQLDREGRAICRIVYAHGLGVQSIAGVFCVSEDTVIQAIQNKANHEQHDTEEHDYFYVSKEYRDQYPSLVKPEEHRRNPRQDNASQPSRSSSMGPHPPPIKDRQGEPNEEPKAAKPAKSKNSSGTNTVKVRSSRGTQPATRLRRYITSGAGNNPTCRNFRNNTPMLKTHDTDSHGSALDRKGRAICRIVYPYVKNYSKIAAIFGIDHHRVRRAVLNEYTPADNLAEDYQYAGQEFKDEYPPVRDKRAALSHSRKRQRSPDRSPELDDVRNKRATNYDQPAPTTARMIPVIELPARPKADPGAAGIRSFLKDVGGFDLSKWQETFKEKGLCTMSELTTLACLEEEKLLKTLTKLFADRGMAEVHILLLADALLDLAKSVK